MSELYEPLCAEFAEGETFVLPRGGKDFTYVTGEAVVTRLNTVLGVDGWEFTITAQGHDERHAWVLGQLTAHFPERSVGRAQFGECGLNPGLSLGDARKGAATDALKKCASLIGVGLYLSHKAEVEQATRALIERTPGEAPTPLARKAAGREQDLPADGEPSVGCADCGAAVSMWRRKDGTVWSSTQVADYARQKYGRVLCWACGKRATG